MKRCLFVFFIIFSFVFFVAATGTASDRLGCLTCHRYPGLVKLEAPTQFKVLHIDEEKHLLSPHGKVDCRQCHVNVNQIPHVDITEVECTTSCHLEDKTKIDTTKPALEIYHRDERFAITKMVDRSSCRACHPLYPHSENHKVRALLNMHNGYLVCEVCHLKIQDPADVFYDWKSPEVFEFIGEPYGTHEKREVETERETENVITKMLNILLSEEKVTEEKPEPEYLISRIAAFSEVKGRKTLLMNTSDNEKAREYLSREKSMQKEEKEKELRYFHRDIARKEISVACNGCHSPDGILDFKKLGFNEKRVKDLEYMNIKSMVTKYDVFYLPNLFGTK
jgi:hypothetical protein